MGRITLWGAIIIGSWALFTAAVATLVWAAVRSAGDHVMNERRRLWQSHAIR